MRSYLRSVLAAAMTAALLGAGCTDTDLYVELEPDDEVLRLKLEADVCAPDSLVEEVPYKILFTIDTSLSNKWNDANENRLKAYLKAIESHADRDSVYFGIVTFNDAAHRPTLVFTDNFDILRTAAEALRNESAGAGTNYADAIQEVYKFILDDLNSLSNPAAAFKTHYLVYWLSDGFPTYGTTDRPTLAANVSAVREYLEPKVAEFRFNTLYLESTGEWETPEEIESARLLLKDMAEAGGGTFTNIAAGESFEFDINPQPQIADYTFVFAVASNQNALYGPRHPLPDSDGDGLVDEVELARGLDPLAADTDLDFYRDGLEARTVWLAPDKFNKGCRTGDLDSDGDGLYDCEEQVIGTNPKDPDSDGDFLPDGLEFQLNGMPLANDPNADIDLDKVTDFSEVLTHLDPREGVPEEQQQRWAYRYRKVEDFTEPTTGRVCTTLEVDNIGVYETLETPAHPRGWQQVELVVVYRTGDSSGQVLFARALAKVGLVLPSTQYPPSGILKLAAADFQPFQKTGGANLPAEDPTQTELCNGLDDDADGIVPPEEADADHDGYRICEGDCNDEVAAVHPGATEVCNGGDDNCDGAIDEGCGCASDETRECGVSAGECRVGVQTCLAGVWGGCEGVVVPEPEQCNGLDDDCDGDTDEDCLCTDGQKRACQPGGAPACTQGEQTCVQGVWVTCAEVDTPAEEICGDGLDNDCDDQVDEGCTPAEEPYAGKLTGQLNCATEDGGPALAGLLLLALVVLGRWRRRI